MNDFYRHPQEHQALSGLLQNSVIRLLIGAYHKLWAEATDFAELRNRNLRVTRHNNRTVFRCLEQAMRRLNITEHVHLYTEFQYKYSARLLGVDGDAAIVLSSKCLEDMDEDTLTALLGRQLAHIQCKHVDLLHVEAMFEPLLRQIPFVGAAAVELSKGLLLSWKQCAEMTADRGGTIASGSADRVMDVILHQMGAEMAGISEHSTFLQEEPLEAVDGTIANTIIQRIVRELDAPFGIQRLRNLQRWSHSEVCRRKIPHIYWNSHYGTGWDTGLSASEDLHQALRCRSAQPEEALARMHLAAHKGSAEAMTALGWSYLTGRDGLLPDVQWGLSYLRQAALKQDAGGQYRLSQLYRQGIPGVLEPNLQMADWLLRMAYGQKQPQAVAYMQQKPLSVPSITGAQLTKLLQKHSQLPQLLPQEREQLHKWLWIPRQDTIVAAEIAVNDDWYPQAIAICDTGIYLREETPLPRWITWQTFFQGTCVAAVLPHGIQLQLNGLPIWYGDSKHTSDMVHRLLTIAKAKPS